VSKRRNQLNSTLQRAIQQVISKGLNDPRIRGLITITSVDLREDLRTAKVGVSVLPEERESATIHGLQAATMHIRHEISDLINMPKAPNLVFALDRSLKIEAGVINAINRGLDELDADEDPTDSEPTPSEGSQA
jgi:ribosome-binding factor A